MSYSIEDHRKNAIENDKLLIQMVKDIENLGEIIDLARQRRIRASKCIGDSKFLLLEYICYDNNIKNEIEDLEKEKEELINNYYKTPGCDSYYNYNKINNFCIKYREQNSEFDKAAELYLEEQIKNKSPGNPSVFSIKKLK